MDGPPAIDGVTVDAAGIARRLWDKDASLWSADRRAQGEIIDRLGWLDLPATAAATSREARRFTRELGDDVEQVVILGMGGSSRCAAVCRRIFDVAYARIIDSTVPAAVLAAAGGVDPARALIVAASKSGTTIEVRSLLDYFHARAAPVVGHPGDRFVAVTDPGTELEEIAVARGFQRVFRAPVDVGGRYSALSVFGLLPMELMGIDSAAVVEAARRMAAACTPGGEAGNPGVRLGAALHAACRRGRDKLTFTGSAQLAAFGSWAEQLVAESTGKEGRGMVPVVDEPRGDPSRYAADRIFVSLDLADRPDAEHDEWLAALETAGHPVLRFTLDGPGELGAELFRWQVAVAVLGHLLGINPFDQPDVQASKTRTAEILGDLAADGPLPEDDAPASPEDLVASMRGILARARPPAYVAIQAFLADHPRTVAALQRLRGLIFERVGVATTVGWGPGFLHSTGQLHKGGPESGIFIQITAEDPADVEVPGAGYSFGQLARAQARGDLMALRERGRDVLRLHLADIDDGLATLRSAVGSLAGSGEG